MKKTQIPSFICGTWHIHTWDVIVFCVGHDSFVYVGHDSFVCGRWRIHMCDMTHSYLEHDSFINIAKTLTRPHICSKVEAGWVSVTHSCKGHDLLIFQTWFVYKRRENTHKSHIPSVVKSWLNESLWLIHIWDMTHIYVGHDSFICGTWLLHEIRENAHNS
jgi:hypothetical protein